VIRLVRATREADGVAIGASVRGSLALERATRAWALLNGREFVTPVDVEQLFLPVVMHRIVFTPSFVAEAREVGWTAASSRFREQCLTLAPRPGEELEAVAAAAAS
jgi:MoxR-like ATPase